MKQELCHIYQEDLAAKVIKMKKDYLVVESLGPKIIADQNLLYSFAALSIAWGRQ